jgi:hypothetical protein
MNTTARLLRVASAAVVAFLASAGCSDNPVGRICDLGLDDPGLNQAVVGSPSLDCPTRTCLKYPVDPNKDLPEGFRSLSANKGMCTATCESDDDCDKVPESPCVEGFTCGVALTVGPFCCQKFCICKDYVVLPPSGQLPDKLACDPTNTNNVCCNLPDRVGNPMYPNCPG